MYDLLQPGVVHISVWNCRAMVSRYIPVPREPTALISQIAANWLDLEEAAGREVFAQGGAINLSGIYDCSDRLAARVTGWEE